MDYSTEINNLYKEIADLKKWLLENTPTLNEFEQLNATVRNQLQALAKRIQLLEAKINLLESKIQ